LADARLRTAARPELSSEAAIAQDDLIVIKFKLFNDSPDYVFYNPNRMVVDVSGKKMQEGDGRGGKLGVIDPGKKGGGEIKLKGSGLHVAELTVDPQGIQRVPASGEVLKAADFSLPASNNEFKTGGFTCNLTKTSQSTDLTAAQFSCVYGGEGLGFIDPAKVGVKVPSGQEFANTNRKIKAGVVKSGDTFSFLVTFEILKQTVDMQFATLQVLWRDAFSESKPNQVASQPWQFKLNEALTTEKNQ
jgi:hypothetical protein